MTLLEHYLAQPYMIHLSIDDDDDWVARIPVLPGCAAHGRTQQEALAALAEAKILWITDCIECGDPLPLREGQGVVLWPYEPRKPY